MKHTAQRKTPLALLLALCLALQLCVPALASGPMMTAGSAAIRQLEEEEGFRAEKYSANGKWYIGYGTECGADDYPGGITQQEAETLLLGKVADFEVKLNDFFARRGITPTQGQFDALICFSYNYGSGWMSGTSKLVKIAGGEVQATRLEVAQAFGEWCHSGGQAQPGLADRRLQEAALYLDGSTAAADTEFAYLIINKEDGVSYETDFRVYQRGTAYGSFPAMEKLGSTFAGLKTASGAVLTESSIASGNVTAIAAWSANSYTGTTYSDVKPGDWFYDYVMELSAQGIVGGNGDGTFAPNRATSTGEMLKLVLLATGHKQQAPTGTHWASGYGTYALSMSYLSRDKAEALDSPISRLEVARLAAKAMGYGASSSASPFADVNDGYATALCEAGIFIGTTVGEQTYFYPDSSITRAEVATIVWRIYQANATNTKQKIHYGNYTLDVLEGVPTNNYDKSAFYKDGSIMRYNDPNVRTRLGIDVSQYQGDIDWTAVAGSGVEFAIARVGGRGYTAGAVFADPKFDEYADGAASAGLQVGAYFFSQAISVAEAEEEAHFVLDKLRGHSITGPVVFDWEVIGKSSARTYGIETSVLCACARAFCKIIEDAGYDAMIYINNYAGYIKYDLSQVVEYPLWYANYSTDAPTFYYDFAMWQYTSKGSVPGIKGNVDMDLWFIK